MDGVEYTLKEVAAHNTAADTWMAIHGQVYDVTKYAQDHPGGADVLFEAAGKDASGDFDNAGHSEDAFEIMAEYRIGTLLGPKKKPSVRIASQPSAPVAPSNNGGKSNMLSDYGPMAAVALGAAGLFHVASQRGMLTALPKLVTSKTVSARPSGFGFVEGLVLTSTVVAIMGAVLTRGAFKIINIRHTYMDYPAHYKMPKRAELDVLSKSGWLHPTNFQSLPLVKKDLVAPNTYLMTFELPTPSSVLGLPIGQHVAITATVEGQAVTRSYTPVSNNADKGRLELLVKCYPDGKLTGGYLANVEVGDEVQFRGPKGAMRYKRGHCKRIGMLAGGSGITPMYQLIRAICEDQRDTTEISLIYANRTEDDILMRRELDTFARRYPKNFKIYYVLDHPPADWQGGAGFVTKDMMAQHFPAAAAENKIMLCGPPGMLNAAKKGLVELGFEKPSAMSKMSDQIFLF